MRPMDEASHERTSSEAATGIGVDDLTEVMQELFFQAVADARAVADPEEDLDAFLGELWVQVSAAFGLTRREWLEDSTTPWPALVDHLRGESEALLEGRLPPGGSAA